MNKKENMKCSNDKKSKQELIDDYIRNIAKQEVLKELQSERAFNKMQSEQTSQILGALNGWKP